MISKPQGYDEAPAYTGEFMQLPKGKYVCTIKQVATQKSNRGNEQFVILYDIAEGEYKDFYKKMYEADKAQQTNAKWRGVFKQNMDGKGLPWLKGIITAIERSNNFTFPWGVKDNERAMAGKKFGGVFRRRQYETEDGRRPIVTELFRIRSVAGLAEAEMPEDDLLPDVPPVGQTTQTQRSSAPSAVGDGFMDIPEGSNEDEGIPFL